MNAGKQQRAGEEREEARRKNGRGKRGREKDEGEGEEEEEGEEVEVGSVRKEEVEGGYGEEHVQREIKREKARGARVERRKKAVGGITGSLANWLHRRKTSLYLARTHVSW